MSIVAYVDESVDQNKNRVFVLGAIVAYENTWKEFEPAMRARLDQDGIEVFHSADCDSCWGEFAKFRDNRTKAKELTTDIVSLILSSNMLAYCSPLSLSAYNEIVKGKIHPLVDDPYFLCLVHLLKQIIPQIDKEPLGETIRFVFEQQKGIEHRALEMYNIIERLPIFTDSQKARLGAAAFAEKSSACALHIADLVTRECFKAIDNPIVAPDRPERKAMMRLKPRIVRTPITYMLDRRFLVAWMAEWSPFERMLRSTFPELGLSS